MSGTNVGCGITEWLFPNNVSQSTIDGRTSSNACTFIALCFGSNYHQSSLPTPTVGQPLSLLWQEAVIEAIRTGNQMYDEMYDESIDYEGNGIKIPVDAAVNIACGSHDHVIEILREYIVFGEESVSQFAEVINSILQQKGSFHVLRAYGRAMMIIVDDNGTLIFIDSHMHGDSGALVARSDPYQGQQAQSFSTWVNQMLNKCHGVGLYISSLTTVTFEQKENVDTI